MLPHEYPGACPRCGESTLKVTSTDWKIGDNRYSCFPCGWSGAVHETKSPLCAMPGMEPPPRILQGLAHAIGNTNQDDLKKMIAIIQERMEDPPDIRAISHSGEPLGYVLLEYVISGIRRTSATMLEQLQLSHWCAASGWKLTWEPDGRGEAMARVWVMLPSPEALEDSPFLTPQFAPVLLGVSKGE